MKVLFKNNLGKNMDSKFSLKTFHDNQLQVHYERIADFIKCGYGVWFHKEGDDIVFHDGDSSPCFREEGPVMDTFCTSNFQISKSKIAIIWNELAKDAEILKGLFNQGYVCYNADGEFEKRVGEKKRNIIE